MGKLAKVLEKVNQALDMSKKARIARAKEQGFDTDTVYYHGTSADIKEFDPKKIGSVEGRGDYIGEGIFFSADPRIAGSYAQQAKAKVGGLENVLPVYTRMKNPLVISKKDDFKFFLNDIKINDKYRNDPYFKNLSDDELRQVTYYDLSDAEKASYTKSKGYDGLVDNTYSQGAVFDPNQIRSVHAAFDPAKKDSANLLAGVTGATVAADYLFPEKPLAQDFTQRRASKKDQWKELRQSVIGAHPIESFKYPPVIEQTIEAPKSETLLTMARGAQAYNDFVDKPLINLFAPELPAELWRKQAYGQPTTLGERTMAAIAATPL